MGRLFGTDGIRGIANREPITPEMGLKMGHAVALHFRGKSVRPKIVIGRDTRFSGKMLEYALVSGLLSMGAEAILLGEHPTPGVAFITKRVGADAGIMISASHNPYQYNGFKFFSSEGYKLTDEEEKEIETRILEDIDYSPFQENLDLGEVQHMDKADELYLAFLKGTLPGKQSLKNMKVVLDCANGATSRIAPILFEGMGVETDALFIHPDGTNINEKCGSQHPEPLSRRVREKGADVGLAFDGDGDRVIAVDDKGCVLNGDQILIICAKLLKDRDELTNNQVVSTVMSNMGFRIALRDFGIEHISTNVGDRYVMEEMRAKGAILGGEESGHIIFSRHHTTGDGLLSALQLLWAVKTFDQPLSQLSKLMSIFPQSVMNVAVKQKPQISSIPAVVEILQKVELRLGEKGRVLVRYSGTEPVCRIMIEGESKKEIDRYAQQIADVVGRCLG